MSIENILCHYCGLQAQCFCLVQGLKLAACATHTQNLLRKGFNTHTIEAYYFIDSPEDVPLYADRRRKAAIALGNIALWESQLDTQHQSCIHSFDDRMNAAIELLQRSFHELRLQVEGLYQEMRGKLEEMKAEILSFLHAKDNSLDEDADLLCQSMRFAPKFYRLMIADLTVPLAETFRKHSLLVLNHFDAVIACVDQEIRESHIQVLLRDANHLVKEGQIEFAAEVLEYAKSLGAETDTDFMRNMLESHRRHIDQKIIDLFPLSKSEEEVKKAAEAYFQEGVSDTSAFAENLTNLETAWRLLEETKTANKQTSKVGAALGELLCFHFSRHEEALRVVRRSLEIEVSLDPLSDSAMNLRKLISAIYDFEGNYESSEEACRTTLQLFSDSSNSSDSYWTTLFFLCRAYIDQFKASEAKSLIEQALIKSKEDASNLSATLKHMLKAWLLLQTSSAEEAEADRVQANTLASQSFPSSIFAALNLVSWASQHSKSNKHKAIALRLQAHSILSRHFPVSRFTRTNLFWLYHMLGPQSFEAARIREDFCETLRVEHPLAYETAMNLLDAANAYFDRGQFQAAISARKAAHSILCDQLPGHITTALNLTALGDLYLLAQDPHNAKYQYLESMQLHERNRPASNEAAFNLYRLAILEIRSGGQKEAASERAKAALAIWSANRSSMARSHGQALVKYLGATLGALFPYSSLN